MLTQKHLITRIQEKTKHTNLRQYEIQLVLKTLVEELTEAVSNGEELSITGLGKFYPRFIKGKKIKKTGIAWMQNKEFDIPDRYRVGFAPSTTANRKMINLTNHINSLIAKTNAKTPTNQ